MSILLTHTETHKSITLEQLMYRAGLHGTFDIDVLDSNGTTILYDRITMEPKHSTMHVVCGWCGCDLGTIDGKGETGVSHGICEPCARKELPRHKPESRKTEYRKTGYHQ